MSYNFNLFKARAKEVNDWLVRELATIRTGRATPTLLDSVLVEIYGSKMPLKQVGSISVEDPHTLRLGLWDKSQMKAVEGALQLANLGVSIMSDSEGIRVIFPSLTTEKRQLLIKLTKDKIEAAKISLRQEREKVWNDVQAKEKAKELSEDDKFRAKEELQRLMHEENNNLESLGERKAKEIEA